MEDYKKLIENSTHQITDENFNKWKVIELSDLEEIMEAYHQSKVKNLGLFSVVFSETDNMCHTCNKPIRMHDGILQQLCECERVAEVCGCDKTIVLVTSGKYEDVEAVKVELFNSHSSASEYCRSKTDYPMNEKYWTYAEIVEDGMEYEMERYANYKTGK